MDMYVVALDAMGGDKGPEEVAEGAVRAVRKYKDVKVLLAGDINRLKPVVDAAADVADRLEIIPTTQVIEMDEAPAIAVHRKTDSSLVRAMLAVREKRAGAVVSAGSTGAVLMAGMTRLGRIRGIDRAALAPVVPGSERPWLLIDSGAHVDCQPRYLTQFGLTGRVYMREVMGVENPKVGLANIGAEEEKGNKLAKEAHQMMRMLDVYNFVGNCEARDIPTGACDVVVADGFSGNIILKYTEGMASAMTSMLKKNMMKSLRTKIGGMLSKPAFREFKNSLDFNVYGGAPLLGVDGAVIKAHGASGAQAIENAIRQARTMLANGVVEKIRAGLTNLAIENETEENN
ncbi:MAG: phosphate acyltransferase PlsX [Clostridia bacterium]|nr:phosphate acyltransferase PlsX [Clostridia bacterium]